MELEELKSKWQSTEAKVEEIHQIVTAMNQVQLQKQNRRTKIGLSVGPITELIVGAAIMLAAGGFIADKWTRIASYPLGAVPAVLAGLFGWFLIWQGIWQLIFVDKLDYAGSVTETQSSLLNLRKFRARTGQFVLLAGIAFWHFPPLFFLQWVGHFDIAKSVNWPWMFANSLIGIVISSVLIAIARRLPPTSAFNRFASDVFAGGEVERAERTLNQISEFRAV